MSVFKWKKAYTRKKNTSIINVLMKECLTVNYDISSIRPCWLVFRHLETNDYCSVGQVKEGMVVVGDLLPKETKTLVRTYKEWDESVARYLDGDDLSKIEIACAKEILKTEAGATEEDKEWCHLKRYWNNLKEIS